MYVEPSIICMHTQISPPQTISTRPCTHAYMHACAYWHSIAAASSIAMQQLPQSQGKKKATSKGCDLGYLDLLY